MAKKHSTDPTLRELERELYSTTQSLSDPLVEATRFTSGALSTSLT